MRHTGGWDLVGAVRHQLSVGRRGVQHKVVFRDKGIHLRYTESRVNMILSRIPKKLALGSRARLTKR